MKVTTKGQVTIPARIREYLGTTPNSDVDFRISGGTVVLLKHKGAHEPRGRFVALRGVLKGTHTTDQWIQATRGSDAGALVDTNVLVDVLTDDPQWAD